MKPVIDVLIAGAGRLAAPLAEQLVEEGRQVAMLRRSEKPFPQGVAGIRHDLGIDAIDLPATRVLLCCLTPASTGKAGYQAAYQLAPNALLRGLANQPGCMLLVSSSRVYAEDSGGWVDEHSAVAASDYRSAALLGGEQDWLQAGPQASVVRFSGLYDGQSQRLLRRADAAADQQAAGVQWTNRIHRADATAVLHFLISRALAGRALAPVWLASDECPVPRHEVMNWLRRCQGKSAIAVPESGAPQFGKRCDSSMLRQAGYRFRYPDYRAGYSQARGEGTAK